MKRDHVELAVNFFFVVLLSINQSKYQNKRKYAWIDNRKVDGQLVLEKVPEEVDWEQADSPRCWCWYTASCRLHYRPLSSRSWQFHILTQKNTERKSMILEFKMQRAELIDSNLFPTERTRLFFCSRLRHPTWPDFTIHLFEYIKRCIHSFQNCYLGNLTAHSASRFSDMQCDVLLLVLL